tara:strand:+ start:145 stop:420 length:276 start_codon:yes stop_codon:yes gene_type:complete
MNVNKKYIVRSISKNSLISSENSSKILELFLHLIKNKSKSFVVKVPSFGAFSYRKSKKRVGRNPKTNESYIIVERNRLNFRSSIKIKNKFN